VNSDSITILEDDGWGKAAKTFFAVAGGYSFKMFNVLHQNACNRF
jgi:hypothetical protein